MSPLASLGRHDCFGRLCNQFLPKKTAFFSAKAQNPRIRRSRILGIVCRLTYWNVFRLWNRRSDSGLWLGAFGRSGFFRCQSRSFRPAFWLPCVIPTNAFAAGNSCFTNSCVQKLKNSAKPNSGDGLPDFLWRNLILAFGKAGETSLLKMRQKSRERGAFASGNFCFISSRVHKSCKKLRFLRYSAKQNSWIVCRGFRMARGWHSKPRKSLCDRIHLTFATVSRCLHSLRSVDMTAFASGNSCFISSPVQKLKNSAKQNSWTVCRFSLWNSARCSGLWLTAFDK